MKLRTKLLIQTVFMVGILTISTSPVSQVQGATYGNDEFLDSLNAAITNIIESGDYDTIWSDWFEGTPFVVDDTDANTAFTFPTSPTDGGTLADIIAAGKIVFGSDTTYPPFESIDSVTSEVVGFDADIADAIAAEFTTAFGVTIVAEMFTTAWDPIIPDLQAGATFDAILSAMTKTDARALQIDFTRAYYTSSQGVLVGPKAAADNVVINTVDDLNNATMIIGLQSGTTSDIYAQDNLPLATVLGFDSFDLVIAALEAQDVHAVLADAPVLEFYATATVGTDVVDTFSDENFGVGVRKDTTDPPTTSSSTSDTGSDEDDSPVSPYVIIAGIAMIPILRRKFRT